MARGTLTVPKSAATRHRRGKPTHETRSVTRDGVLRGPDLAEATGRDDWPEPVLAWWEDWRASPQAALFEVTDWRRLALLASTVRAYLRRPSASLLSEIRLNEERLGALYTDRLRGRIQIEDESAGPDLAAVSSIESSRASARSRLRPEGEEDG